MSMTKRFYNGFLKVFGDIKVFKWPMFLIYDPGSYLVKGHDMREVLDMVQPGDILLRGYNNYLDGYFIPGYFSHVGFYVGQVKVEDVEKVSIPKGKHLFCSGEQMVVHAMAEGVFVQDILDFCRADRMLIVRFPEELKSTEKLNQDQVPFESFTDQERDLFKRLNDDESLSFTDIFPMLFDLALSQVGKKYDFSFDFKNYNNLSCTEFLYFLIKSLESFHCLKPTERKFFFYQKTVVVPDSFTKDPFHIAWKSRSIDQKKLDNI